MGRFVKGNPGGPGNPAAPIIERFRHVLVNGTTNEEVLQVWRALIDKAIAGDTQAGKIVLDRLLGKAVQPLASLPPGGAREGDGASPLVQFLMADPANATLLMEISRRSTELKALVDASGEVETADESTVIVTDSR